MQTFNEIRYDKLLKLSEEKYEKRKWLFVLLITFGYDRDEVRIELLTLQIILVDPNCKKV